MKHSQEISSHNPARSTRAEFAALAVLIVAGLFLRWWHLDSISFRYDSAEAAFRARETFRIGHPPLTGIVNSLGFRNAPGFIWLILPPFLFSPDVRSATAWMGLLSMSGILPLYWMARRWFSRFAFFIPCGLFAMLPMHVFGGRALWAQNLMPMLGAWALFFLSEAIDTARPDRRRGRALVLLAVTLLLAASVHFSGVLALGVAGLFLLRPLARGSYSRRALLAVGCALVVGGITFIPSLLDWHYRQEHPLSKPEHVVEFEAMLPPEATIPVRLGNAYAGLFEPIASGGVIEGVEPLPEAMLSSVRIADLLLLVFVMAGIGRAALIAARAFRSGAAADKSRGHFALILLAWVFIPPAMGAILIPRVNASYFVFSLPALFLFALIALEGISNALKQSRKSERWGTMVPLVGSLFVVFYFVFNMNVIHAISKTKIVQSNYYIPLRLQQELADRIAEHGVPPGQLVHLSGGWFERPYEYLLTETSRRAASPSAAKWALIEDRYLRRNHPLRLSRVEENSDLKIGTMSAIFFPDAAAAQSFYLSYRRLPAEN